MLQILQVKKGSQVEKKKCGSELIFIQLALFSSFWAFNMVFQGSELQISSSDLLLI